MNNVAEKLYNILGTKFDNTDIKTLDSTGKETTDMEEIEMFSFDFLVDSRNYGPVVILLSAEDNLEVYYGDNTSRSLDRAAKKKWENLIEHLSTFARGNRLGYSLKHTSDLKYDLSNIADITESYKNIFEGYYGTTKTSYNKIQEKAKIIIRHSKKIGEEDKRFRNISTLFIENADGERFKLPFTKLTGARAMARHVTEGGNPYDLFGTHICEMVKDINTLGGFVRRSKCYEGNEEALALVETGRTHYNSMRKGLKQIAGKRGYNTYKESWEPSEITEMETDTNAIRSLFTEKTVNQRTEDALPLLARLQQMAETSDQMKAMTQNRREDMLRAELSQAQVDGHPKDVEKLQSEVDALEETPKDGSKPKVEDTYNKIKDWPAPALRGYARKVGLPSDVISSRMDTDQLIDEIMGYLYDDNWQIELMALGENTGTDYNPKVRNTMKEINEFEDWADQVVEGTWAVPSTPKQITALQDWLSKEQPVGIDAMNVTDALYNIIGDDDLYDSFDELAQDDPDSDARILVRDWISKYDMDLAHKLGLHGEYDNAAARDFPREGCEGELDADNEQQLNASVNKDVDQYVKTKSTPEDKEMKPFTEYVAEEEAEIEEAKDTETEVVDEEKDKEWKKPWEADKEEDTKEEKEEVQEAGSPYVTLDNQNDLSDLMQRTNFLLKK